MFHLMLRRSFVIVLCALAVAVGQAQSRTQVSLIVANGIVVTVDGKRRVIRPGSVAIDGRDIVAVDTADAIAARYPRAETIDATGAVVMPGLINTHTHAPMVLFRGLADDLALMDWLQKYIFPAEAKTVSPEFVRAGTRLAALEMIRSGTTTYVDMYYFEEEIARATKAAGLRGVLGQTIIQFPVADAKTPAEGLARTERFIKEFEGDDLITPAVAPHSMYTLDAATLKARRALADGYARARHHPPRRDEGRGRDVTREVPGHAGRLSRVARLLGAEHDRRARRAPDAGRNRRSWRSRHVGVSHNPESNMKLASGAAPVVAMRAAGIAVGLGTDGAASNNDLDMFEAMRQAAFLHKLATDDPRAMPAPVGARAWRPSTARARSAWSGRSARSSPASAPT